VQLQILRTYNCTHWLASKRAIRIQYSCWKPERKEYRREEGKENNYDACLRSLHFVTVVAETSAVSTSQCLIQITASTMVVLLQDFCRLNSFRVAFFLGTALQFLSWRKGKQCRVYQHTGSVPVVITLTRNLVLKFTGWGSILVIRIWLGSGTLSGSTHFLLGIWKDQVQNRNTPLQK